MAVRDINKLLPVAQKACRLFLSECEKEGLPVLITETYRSQERQNELYAQGRTKPGKVVTWTKNSRHTSRLAWDICKNVKGAEYSDTSFFKKCGAIAKKLGITWGGDWKTPDMPHFEVTKSWDYESEDKSVMEELKAEISLLKDAITSLKDGMLLLKKENELLKAQLPKVYHYTKDVPEWGRATVQRMLDSGVFAGAAPDDLNLSEEMLRMMVMMERKE